MSSSRLLRTAASATAGALIAAAAIALGAAVVSLPHTTRADAAVAAEPLRSRTPKVPRVPQNFRGRGRYVVRDLGVNVPLTWEGRGGDSQMTAGGPQYPIWFTNLIYQNNLYTLTYRWPTLPPDQPCSRIPGFNVGTFNQLLGTSRFVGREIVRVANRRRDVNHWRMSVVLGPPEPGETIRIPIADADFYVQRGDPAKIWQVLHFGLQNLFDPALDEWIRMRTFQKRPGQVVLPAGCPAPTP
jgi:hypothetical protein